MLIYEVTATVDADVAEPYAAWLVAHAPDVVAAGGFDGAELLEADPEPDDPGSGQAARRRFVARYHVPGRAALDAYLAGPAAALRADAEARFGGRFSASRRVLVPLAS